MNQRTASAPISNVKRLIRYPNLPATNSCKPELKHRTSKQSKSAYQRGLDLIRLIPLMPNEVEDHSALGNAHIIAKIKSALRSERCRGRSGHWSYNLNRHAALLEALKAETRNQQLSNRSRTFNPRNRPS